MIKFLGRWLEQWIQIQNYTLKIYPKITGLSEQLIRKWENGYKIAKPERLANRYRVYSQEGVVTLLEVKKDTNSYLNSVSKSRTMLCFLPDNFVPTFIVLLFDMRSKLFFKN